MSAQTEMFPKTELDDANAVLNKLLADEEKAEKACGTADEKLSQIQYLILRQRRVISHLQTRMPATDPAPEVVGEDVVEEAEWKPLAIEGDVLDPETGEIMSRLTCPDCDGDGRIPDKTGGGHHGTCPTCGGSGRVDGTLEASGETDEQIGDTTEGEPETIATPHVFVYWPGSPGSVRTEIGEHTTYGELVADYCSAALTDGKIEDFNVVSEHGSIRPLNSAIVPPDYGREFRIVAKATEAELVGHDADMATEPAA